MEQAGVRCLLDGRLGVGQLGFEPKLCLVEFRPAVVNVSDQGLVGLVEQLEVAKGPLALELGRFDLPTNRRDSLRTFLGLRLGQFADPMPQQGLTVGDEDLAGEDLVEFGERLLVAPEAIGRMTLGDVGLLGLA
ncbi:hypothetical protein ILP97_08815 [Amycolatopsis sp. H6(2020)]|nr:hypothetical protein [Amycolatopsis sp. H6(2020)]